MEISRSDDSPLSKKDNSETALIGRLKVGDETAFEAIYNRYQQKVRAYAYVITHSEFRAEEMVQEIFMKLWTSRSNLSPELSFEHYLFKMTQNMAFDYLKKVASSERLKKEQAALIGKAGNNTRNIITFKEYQEVSGEVADGLPEQKRAIYKLSLLKGLSNEEISGRLGISLKTVRNNRSQIVKTIKKRLRRIAEITLPFLPFLLIF